MITSRSAFRFLYRLFSVLFLLLILTIVIFRAQSIFRETLDWRVTAPEYGRFVSGGDVELFVQEIGPQDGVPVVLVHGTGAWSELWRENMDFLGSHGFRAIALDVPPFGYSDKPKGPLSYSRTAQADRILGVIESLSLKKPIMVAHSVGAKPALEAVYEEQAKFGALVLIDPALGLPIEESSGFDEAAPGFLMNLFFKFDFLRDALISTYGANPIFTERLFKSFVFNHDAVTEERVAVLQKPLLLKGVTSAQADWLEYLLVYKDTSQTASVDAWSKISLPVLIIWGDKDTVTPLWQGELLSKVFPNAQLKVINEAGHLPHIEDEEAFTKILLEFLAAVGDKL